MSKKLGSWGDRPLGLSMIPCVEAVLFPDEVLEWCADKEIPTHYDSSVSQIADDGNILVRWLQEFGLDVDAQPHYHACGNDKGHFYVGIIGS